MCERVAYQFKMGVPDYKMGGQCALLKVNASRCFEFCAREASQIFGGASVVREGQGKLVERMYRSVRATAIPGTPPPPVIIILAVYNVPVGGSEEILLDFTMRQVAARAAQLKEAKL